MMKTLEDAGDKPALLQQRLAAVSFPHRSRHMYVHLFGQKSLKIQIQRLTYGQCFDLHRRLWKLRMLSGVFAFKQARSPLQKKGF